jgi:hypothetical protein
MTSTVLQNNQVNTYSGQFADSMATGDNIG